QRLAPRRAPLGHRAVRGRDRAGRRAGRGHCLPRPPLARERAGLSPTLRSPLASWFAGPAARRRFTRRVIGRRVALLSARDAAWRGVAPGFSGATALMRAGVPFQIALERRYDRSGDPRRLPTALKRGATVYLPQAHQVLPRVARLMVALRETLLGARHEECSFLFLVEGRGRVGLGLHHDGEVDAFWLQLEGRRTVTLGPPVAPRTALDLDGRLAGGALACTCRRAPRGCRRVRVRSRADWLACPPSPPMRRPRRRWSPSACSRPRISRSSSCRPPRARSTAGASRDRQAPPAVLLRLGRHRRGLRHDGDRRQHAHGLLPALPADPRGVRLGP